MAKSTNLDTEALIADRKAGMSLEVIAKRHGCHPKTVGNHLRGVVTPRPGELRPKAGNVCAHRGCTSQAAEDSHLCAHHDNPRFFPRDFLTHNERYRYEALRDTRTRVEAMLDLGRQDLVTAEILE